MILPTKHENLEKNLLVLGADILKHIKQASNITIEEGFQLLKSYKNIEIDRYFDALTMLYILDFIFLENNQLTIKDHN